MSWFRHQVEQGREAPPWVGPFAPAPSTEPPKFDRMVRTAGELVAPHGETVSPAASAAPADSTSVAA